MSLNEADALAGDIPGRPSSPSDSDIQTDVLLRGFLTKRGAVVKNWQVRYFVLEYGRLSYYNDQRVCLTQIHPPSTFRCRVPHTFSPFFFFV